MCKGLTWKMLGVSFDSDMLILPIGGCNMVLGIQWLITLGDIMWNFKKLKMEFHIMGRKISLRGSQPPAAKLVQQQGMNKLLAQPSELCMISVGKFQDALSPVGASLFSLEGSGRHEEDEELQLILQTYQDLFATPIDLPPSRSHDHKIILKEGTSLINIRPYRYPTIQKDEIERWCVKCWFQGD